MANPIEVIIIAISVLAIIGCSQPSTSLRQDQIQSFSENSTLNNSSNNPNLLAYTIISDKSFKRLWRTIHVRIQEPVAKPELRDIGETIRAMDPNYDSILVGYFLPSMKIQSGAWATSRYKPELELKILGASISDRKMMLEQASHIKANLGKWFDNAPYMSGVITLHRNGEVIVREEVFQDGSTLRREHNCLPTDAPQRIYLEDGEDVTKEFYIIADDGWLEMWDVDGLFRRAQPLQ